MKKLITALFALGTLLIASCETKAGTGALAGGAVGATAGGLIGKNATGALIGGAVGAAAGGLIGAALDEQDRKVMEQSSPRTVERMDNNEPLTIDDVIKLSQGGVSDETIIRYIKQRKTKYNLTKDQITRLQEGGVSPQVINYMIDSGK